jgi:hypothetical protein
MGDAYTAVATDESSLFYNPAGLARVRGINWHILSAAAGGSGVSAFKKIKDIKSGSDSAFADAIQDLYGDHVSAQVGGESIFTMPLLGFGVYDHSSAILRIDTPVDPALRTTVINDYGYVMGVGIPMGFFHWGLDLKYIKRTGTDTTFGAGDVADFNSDAIVSRMSEWGVGYGADTGMSLVIPTPIVSPVFSVAWKNIGQTEFRSKNLSDIPPELNDITLGTAVGIDLPLISITPALDVRYLNRSDLPLTRKINFGIEIDLPLIDIRGGFHEGYYTAGAGVNLGLFRVDAATYGVELGDYPGQIEDRRYVVEFIMHLGLGNFSATGGGSGKKGGRGTASGDNSIGGKRLKRRR